MTGRVARNKGIAGVRHSNEEWFEEMIKFVANLPSGWTGTGETIRHQALEKGIHSPTHHNAWGAVILHAKKRNILFPICFEQMKDERSHARQTPKYIKN